jgi:hypothetical protein
VRKANSDPRSKPDVQSGFTLTASTSYQLVSREIGLANLKPGGYLLEVTVTESGTSNTVSRRRALNILER